MRSIKMVLALFAGCLLVSAGESGFSASAQEARGERPIQVFVLAGQSNMEGKARNELFEYQATHDPTREFFAHLREGDGWIERDDVFIKFLNRHGPLTLGYGSPNKTGLEFQFGYRMGEHFEQPVLLIKTAWGGHSLYQKFRPPSAGLPPTERLEQELAAAQKRVREGNEKNNRNNPLPSLDEIKEAYGSSYRNMMEEIRVARENVDTLFPELAGRDWEFAGFVWFQGFNDMFGDYAPAEYAENMKLFINDVRKDLDAPHLPFVIGALGQHGSGEPNGNMRAVQEAQLSMNAIPEFQGNVIAIETAPLVDKAAEELFPTWQENVEAWEKVGSDRPYHYLGSAIWFTRIGDAMADAMLELLGGEQPSKASH